MISSDVEIDLPEPVDDIEDNEEEGHSNEEKSAKICNKENLEKKLATKKNLQKNAMKKNLGVNETFIKRRNIVVFTYFPLIIQKKCHLSARTKFSPQRFFFGS